MALFIIHVVSLELGVVRRVGGGGEGNGMNELLDHYASVFKQDPNKN